MNKSRQDETIQIRHEQEWVGRNKNTRQVMNTGHEQE